MESVIQNPGLQHIAEMILLNLDFEDLKRCQLLNKFFKDVLESPMFWLRKWRTQRGLSKENNDDWVKAIQLTKNTNLEINLQLYLEKVIENGHVVDVPCFIDANAVEKSNEFTFERAFEEKELGILQILASMENNPKYASGIHDDGFYFGRHFIGIAVIRGHLNIVKILASITKHSICTKHSNLSFGENECTPIHDAAWEGHADILKFLLSFTNDPKIYNWELLRTPIAMAAWNGHHECVRLLQSFINTGNF